MMTARQISNSPSYDEVQLLCRLNHFVFVDVPKYVHMLAIRVSMYSYAIAFCQMISDQLQLMQWCPHLTRCMQVAEPVLHWRLRFLLTLVGLCPCCWPSHTYSDLQNCPCHTYTVHVSCIAQQCKHDGTRKARAHVVHGWPAWWTATWLLKFMYGI